MSRGCAHPLRSACIACRAPERKRKASGPPWRAPAAPSACVAALRRRRLSARERHAGLGARVAPLSVLCLHSQNSLAGCFSCPHNSPPLHLLLPARVRGP